MKKQNNNNKNKNQEKQVKDIAWDENSGFVMVNFSFLLNIWGKMSNGQLEM